MLDEHVARRGLMFALSSPSGAGKSTLARKLIEDDPDGIYHYTAIHFVGDAMLIGYCAGDSKVGALNRLRIRRITLDWLKQRSREGARDERRDAWFWLGQRLGTGVAPLVREALPKADSDLREHLVFVLSQMPAPAAVDALIALVEDRRLDRDLRSRALFWLAQSEDARAFAYLDRRLDPAGS